MAIQSVNFVKGRINNLVFFERAGTFMARSLPDKVRMSAASKQCSGNFGKASACGKMLRTLLAPVLPFAKDRRMQVRFSGAIARWLGAGNVQAFAPTNHISCINGFDFNDATSITSRWKSAITVSPAANGLVQVQVPAFVPAQVMSAPAYCVAIEAAFTIAGCLLANAAATGSHTVKLTIPYNDVLLPAQVINLPVGTPAGSLVVTALALRYRLANGTYSDNPSFLPASVMGACYC